MNTTTQYESLLNRRIEGRAEPSNMDAAIRLLGGGDVNRGGVGLNVDRRSVGIQRLHHRGSLVLLVLLFVLAVEGLTLDFFEFRVERFHVVGDSPFLRVLGSTLVLPHVLAVGVLFVRDLISAKPGRYDTHKKRIGRTDTMMSQSYSSVYMILAVM